MGMVGWTWYFPSVVEINSVIIWEDNINIFMLSMMTELAPNKFQWEKATNVLLGDLSYVLVKKKN
jgi:hypothetical protein